MMIKVRNTLIMLHFILLFGCTLRNIAPSAFNLLEATNNGDYQTVKKLLEKGVNVNVKNSNGMTPLHYASYKGHFDIARLLLQNSADVNIETNGWSAVEIAFARNHVQLAELIIESNSGFLEAANKGDYQRVKQLLEKGWNVNTKDKEAWTLLHHAAINGHTDIAELLLDKGTKIDAKDKEGWTPLMVASANSHTDLATLLIKKGANVNVADKNGITPLHSAAINGYIKLASLLIEKGADVNTENKEGMTPLHLAQSINRTKMVKLLMEKLKTEIVGKINLNSPQPSTIGNLQMNYEGAIYDTYYKNPPHWKIISYHGYMNFSFNGKHEFTYHAGGSTSKGVSYTYIDIYINNHLIESNKFIEAGWKDYIIPASHFSEGLNSVKLILKGKTHFWIKKATVGLFNRE
ncbi:MAG: ankyrin repeat domain-containing protein [Pseudomonadota bacterium]